MFIRQVGSVSQDLIVATNSSFLNYQIIDGIDAGDRYQGIFVTNGTRRLSEALRPDFVTNGRSTFLLNDDKVLFEGITAPPTPGIEGTIELIQRDGTTSRWTFGPGGLISPTLADPNPSNLQGPGWGEPLPVGHIRPISIAGDDVFTESNRGQSGLVVTWSNPLGPSNRPTLVGASYSYQFIGPLGIETLEGATVNVPAAEPSLRRNPNLQVVQITLPGAGATLEDGIGERQSLGVITGTLRGGISFAWGSSDRIQLPAFYIDANGVLRFGGNSSVNVPAPTGGLIDIRGRLVSGSVVELEFRRWEEEVEVDDDTGGFSYESAIAIPGGPSELRLNADYLTYVREAEPNQVTFVSGHTITRGLTVDLLTPASTINIDSPVKVAVDEDIDLRATNINIRATMTSPDRLSIGRSQVARERLSIEPDYVNPYLRTPSVPSLYSFSQIRAGRAVAVVRNFGPGLGGQLTAIEPLPGFQGFGYNPSIPPVVTISGGGGSGATAVAVVSPAGTITGYLVTSPGSGYTGIPTVAVAPPIPQSRATARVVSIDAATGQVLQVEVLDPGYRYQALPRVVITPPSRDGFGVQATARAILDPEGRIVSIEIVNPGSGYTERPEVIVAEPSPPAMAERLTIAAAAAANVFEIYVGDDFGTPTPRGLARISANGSLSTQAEGIQITAILPPPVGSTAVNQQITLGPGASGAFPENFNPVGVALAGFGIREGTRVQAWDPATNTATVPLGSIASTLATPANVSLGVRSESLYLEATQADVVFEGLVNVDKQSYLFNSLPSVRHLAPFTFTTRSAATGELTGTIEGSVVDVVPGNDARTPLTGSTAFHDIDLRTRIDSLRVRAASSASDPQGPFPYRLSIEEIDRISLDAVAASSGPISVTAANGLVLTSAIDTDGDISLVARTNQIDTFANLQVTAPVRTRFGQ
ncbi:MAG: hypothetical protein FJ284_14005, partial [Planctomycetes bacterium]|nr:hypothetical protein [Planctomycetota bacterium]